MIRKEIITLLKNTGLPENIVNHVLAVEKLSLKTASLILNTNPELKLDLELISKGALLHDIGRSVTHKITHAIEGKKLAEKFCKDKRVLDIIENHIGAGITKEEAELLGLPPKDYVPLTLEEKIVANADNLLSGDKKTGILRLYNKLLNQGNIAPANRVLKLYDEIMLMIL